MQECGWAELLIQVSSKKMLQMLELLGSATKNSSCDRWCGESFSIVCNCHSTSINFSCQNVFIKSNLISSCLISKFERLSKVFWSKLLLSLVEYLNFFSQTSNLMFHGLILDLSVTLWKQSSDSWKSQKLSKRCSLRLILWWKLYELNIQAPRNSFSSSLNSRKLLFTCLVTFCFQKSAFLTDFMV